MVCTFVLMRRISVINLLLVRLFHAFSILPFSSSTPDPLDQNLFNHNTFLASHTSFLHQCSTDGSPIIAAAPASHPWPSHVTMYGPLSRSNASFVDVSAPQPNSFLLWTRRVLTRLHGFVKQACCSPLPGAAKASRYLQGTQLPRLSSNTFLILQGFLPLFSAVNDRLQLVETFESSRESAHCHLQDFALPPNTLGSSGGS